MNLAFRDFRYKFVYYYLKIICFYFNAERTFYRIGVKIDVYVCNSYWIFGYYIQNACHSWFYKPICLSLRFLSENIYDYFAR